MKPAQGQCIFVVNEIFEAITVFAEFVENSARESVKGNWMICDFLSSDEPDDISIDAEDSARFTVKEDSGAVFRTGDGVSYSKGRGSPA